MHPNDNEKKKHGRLIAGYPNDKPSMIILAEDSRQPKLPHQRLKETDI